MCSSFWCPGRTEQDECRDIERVLYGNDTSIQLLTCYYVFVQAFFFHPTCYHCYKMTNIHLNIYYEV